MSKMDRQLNSTKDKQTIYEIYRACRLCGAGAGYKMPIIQNVIDLGDSEVELRQKVRECVQIEVHQDDKMPPLICELCVDKVNDFYEFLEMCRQTNKRTRLRLGLPPQSMPKGAPDAGECILGLTEPVYVNDDSDDGEPLSKQKKQTKVKVRREPELKVKLEHTILDPRTTRFTRRAPTPPRNTRQRQNSKEDTGPLNRAKDSKSKSPKGTPKSILKRESQESQEDDSLLTPRLKRSRDREPVKLDTPIKKVKIAIKPASPPKSSPKSSPRSSKPAKPVKVPPKRPVSPPRLYSCIVCGQNNKTPQANSNHQRSHTVGFTNPKLACNPCGEWFRTPDEAAAHHRHHKSKSIPYTCNRCTANFRQLAAYDEHFISNQCIPFPEMPDVKCDVCWHLFATNKLFRDHRCLGEDNRPGGKCSKCNRNYALLRNLKKHEPTCTARKKGELNVDPELLKQLRPVQVRILRCDSLLANVKDGHYDVSYVPYDYGLDKNCYYPYLAGLRIKREPYLDHMVDIRDDIKHEFYAAEDYVHWDSESESEAESCSLIVPSPKEKKIDSLANLSLKTLFSRRCLGKVPKKRRKVKPEKNLFDSLLAEEDDVSKDINNIINNLQDDDNDNGDNEFNDSVKSNGEVVNSNDGVDNNDSLAVSNEESEFSGECNVTSSKLSSGNSIDNVNNSTINEISVNDNGVRDNESNTISDLDDSKNNGVSNDNSSLSNDDKVENCVSKNDFEKDGDSNSIKVFNENSQDSSSIGTASESLLNDYTQNDILSENEKENDKNNVDNSQNNDENQSQTDNSGLDSKLTENESNLTQDKDENDIRDDVNENRCIGNNDSTNTVSVIVSNDKVKHSDADDDDKLMAALDAEIGENNEGSRDNNGSFNDLMQAKGNTDLISDEYNFDA
ncbi:unnamed protein product [Spodoptera littoralis]|uniref:Uncharacterized protein n=1 Tax=Spodoptera littoralis TaxID=7109 RepID=A0A9P0IAJ6_SPOLI|nr:unnamed protein product [Spodoptera littoralis]CAH1642704.1 unnamed protein product [Spodoptera littoralis]